MPTPPVSLTAAPPTATLPAPAPPIPLRPRADLVFVSRVMDGRRCWTVKDPVALRFYEIGDHEQFLLSQLADAISVDELEARFRRRVGQTLPRQQLLEFLGRLWQQGLVINLNPGTGVALFARREQREAGSWISRLAGLLSFRWKGVNPDRFLGWLHGWMGWIYSPPVLGIVLLTILAAAILVVTEFDTFWRRLPDLQSFLNVRDLVTGAILLGGIKVLHELGHGLTCKHFGGECTELGAMWLVVTPALYCNVTDSWLLSSPWKRAAISGAGIVTELFLSAVFTFLWWFSEPGHFHDACLWGMVIGSVNTLLVNGNPLMRYDGYYVLADLLNISNFRARSQREAGALAAAVLLGVRRPPSGERGARRGVLLAYGIASWVYQWVVLIGIVWFLYYLTRPYGLDPFVIVLGTVMLGTRVLTGGLRTAAAVRQWRREGSMSWIRGIIGLAALAAAIWWGGTTPFPQTVRGPALLAPRESQTLYATTPGLLKSAAKPGSVHAGDELFVLDNPDVGIELQKLEGNVARHERIVASLAERVVNEPHLTAQLAAAQASLADHRERLSGRKREAERLRIVAPAEGRWRALTVEKEGEGTSRLLSLTPGDRALRSVRWSDPRMLGAWVPAGTAIAELSTSGEMEARVYVEQSEIPFVRVNQPVRLRLPQVSDRVLEGTVVEVAARNVDSPPLELLRRQLVAAQPSAATGGFPRSRDVLYEVRVMIPNPPHALLSRGTGEAKIEVGTNSLFERLVRFLRLTFRIREGV